MNRTIVLQRQPLIKYEWLYFKVLSVEGEMPPLNEWFPLADLASSTWEVKVINHSGWQQQGSSIMAGPFLWQSPWVQITCTKGFLLSWKDANALWGFLRNDTEFLGHPGDCFINWQGKEGFPENMTIRHQLLSVLTVWIEGFYITTGAIF